MEQSRSKNRSAICSVGELAVPLSDRSVPTRTTDSVAGGSALVWSCRPSHCIKYTNTKPPEPRVALGYWRTEARCGHCS